MRAFIINLDSAPERWRFVECAFSGTRVALNRVAAVDGSRLELPHAGYAEALYRKRHGRLTNPREVGCYFSHIRALQAFLASGEPHGLIGEDDVRPCPDFEEVLEGALRYARHWNILRLSGLKRGNALKAAPLPGERHLCVQFGRLKGAGMYAVDRKAAEALVAGLLPMWLPFDHAFDREWRFGLRAASVQPFPCEQSKSGMRTSIQTHAGARLSPRQRWTGTYPYQAGNEVSRWGFRAVHFLQLRFSA